MSAPASTAQPLVAHDANPARSSLAVAVGSLLTSAFGGLLALLIALIAGEGPKTDAFFAAYSVYLFFTLFGATLRVALVPLLGSVADEERWRATSADAAGRLMGVALVVTAAIVVLSPVLGRLLTPGLPADAHTTAAASLAILGAASCAQIAAATLAAVLAAGRRFAASAAAYVAGSALSAGAAAVLMLAFGVIGAAAGVLAGGLLILVAHAVYLRRFGFVARPWPRAVRERRTWVIAGQASSGAALPVSQQLMLTFALAVVSGTVGAVTAYTYGAFVASVLASVTIYVVGFVMLPNLLAALEEHGTHAAREFLEAAVPIALYLYLPVAVAFATFGRPVIDGLLGGSLSDASLDTLWDCARLFLIMQLGWVLMGPLSSIALALHKRRALLIPALAVLPVQLVGVLIASRSGPVAVAGVHAGLGVLMAVPVLLLTLGRAGLPVAARSLAKGLPAVVLALVIPALALVAPEPSGLIPAAALAAAGVIIYVVLGSIAWPSVGGRTVRMLLARG